MKWEKQSLDSNSNTRVLSKVNINSREEFIVELRHTLEKVFGIVLYHEGKAIGFKEFIGPKKVSPREEDNFNPDFSTSFLGFYGYRMGKFSSLLEGPDKGIGLSLHLRSDYRKRFSGLGKAMISLSLGIMRNIAKMEGFYDESGPLYMAQSCRTPIYKKYFQARNATDYYGDNNDVVVFTDAIFPPLEIRES